MSKHGGTAFTGPNLSGRQQLSFQPKIVRRDLRVARIEEVTPRCRRVVLTGEVLADGFPFVPFACNDQVKVYFPDPVTGRVVAYRETGDAEWEVDSTEGQPIRRDYTPRRWDPVSRELTIDFVVHEHGIAGVWARDAAPGDPLVVMGPRANWLLPQNYGHYLAAGDETALPAISRLIEEAPRHARVTAVVEIADAAERQQLTPAPGVEVDLHWVPRDTTVVGPGCGSALETALRSLDLPTRRSDLYVFAAGEAGAMKPIRRWLRGEVGLPKSQLAVDGYWKRGTADHDHHLNDFDGEDG